MTEQQRRSGALEQRLGTLSREIAPDRDLWPGIASRLGPPKAAREAPAAPWTFRGWLPAGVSLVAGYLIASWFPLPRAPGLDEPDTAPADVPAALLESVQPALMQLPPKTRAVVEVDLSGLEHDRLSIEQALAVDPTNALLRELRVTAESRASSVREQMNRLTASIAEATEI